jgi:hypothetical protein
LAGLGSDLVIAAWGANVPFARDQDVLSHHFAKAPLWCLGLTAKGKPRHPLYVRRDAKPMPFRNVRGDERWLKEQEKK